jgi:glycosyltransferase involved in cell wall biosynthesis
MRIAFLSTGKEKASYRFRIERMLPYFAMRGHLCRTFFLPKHAWGRLRLYATLSSYDVVVLQKRLLSWPELLTLRRSATKLVYDFDDSMMFSADGSDDRKRRRRFSATVRVADLVVCGNEFLAAEAARGTDRIAVVPTAIDTESFHPRLRKADSDRITVGWTGSRSTAGYLSELFPVLAQFDQTCRFKILSDSIASCDMTKLAKTPWTFIPWSPTVEVDQTATFDIGVMPLPDNRWTHGKCGSKLLQYMALGIAAVCTPVGVNCDIVHDGIDGLFARSSAEWFQALARLTRDPLLRETLGQAGRRRVESTYALAIQGPRFVDAIERLNLGLRRSA